MAKPYGVRAKTVTYSNFDDFLARASAQLDPVTGPVTLPTVGDLDESERSRLDVIRPAAVLIPVIPRAAGPSVLLTERPKSMSSHAGQVAFPGGKVDTGDADEVAAALREAHEEVGIDPAQVTLLGRAAPYVSGSAFRITPVLGLLPADFVAVPEPFEVDEVFETPLAFLMDPANHTRGELVWEGKRRTFYDIPHNGHRIWGVTAGIIRELYLRVYS